MTRRPAVTFVVMAGGKGERLWPLVRAGMPKVCLSPDGTRSLLQSTVDRLRPVWPAAHWLIVTTREQAEAVAEHLTPALRRRVVIEPQARDTAACMTLAAAMVARQDPQRVLVITPADHWIQGVRAFQRAIRAAIHAAVREETIATIGIRPTGPQPGLGYLCGEPLANGSTHPRVLRLSRFVEKPTARVAQRLLRRPWTYWNSGVFIGTAETFLLRVTEWLPDHARSLAPLATTMGSLHNGTSSLQSAPFLRRMRAAYRALRPVPFDRGVMEHLQGGLIVEGGFLWADMGSWDVWARFGRTSSRAITVGSENVTVISPSEHLVAAVGVRDLLIVHTPSATLICRADHVQATRQVARRLAADPSWTAYR